jgi:hypothetical protein
MTAANTDRTNTHWNRDAAAIHQNYPASRREWSTCDNTTSEATTVIETSARDATYSQGLRRNCGNRSQIKTRGVNAIKKNTEKTDESGRQIGTKHSDAPEECADAGDRSFCQRTRA